MQDFAAHSMALITATSPHGVEETVARLRAGIEARHIELFAVIDHAAGAREAGLELPAEQVVVFGDPKVGTLLMQTDPRAGYELPLRVLVYEQHGRTFVSYAPPTELAETYDLGDQGPVLERMAGLLAQLVAESTAAA